MLFESPIISLGRLLYEAIAETKSDVKNGDMTELRKEEAKQEISMRMAERQAKVAQELAIAERIRDAEEVNIEEYYDNLVEGGASVSASADGFSGSLAGKSARISKRVFIFKGREKLTIDVLERESNKSFKADGVPPQA
jgi:hypothetical protein